MHGAIAGDVIGSVYEHTPAHGIDFSPLIADRARYTDDSVLTVATAHALLTDGDYGAAYHSFGNRYPHAGYGGAFRSWLRSPERQPYGSWGNGSAMRVSPIGWAFDDEPTVLAEAARSAAVTHDHPDGIKGAQAVALAVLLARLGADRSLIVRELSGRFGYDLSRTVEEIRPDYGFDVSCAGSVPEALVAFLDSRDFEHAVRLAISLGGDSDTQAAIAGAVAEAAYDGVPAAIWDGVRSRLPDDLSEIIRSFAERYAVAFGASRPQP